MRTGLAERGEPPVPCRGRASCGVAVLAAAVALAATVSCSGPSDASLLRVFHEHRAAFVELADLSARHPETRGMTPDSAEVPAPPIGAQPRNGEDSTPVVPGWSPKRQQEFRRLTAAAGDPHMVVTPEAAPGWTSDDLRRFRTLFKEIGRLTDVGSRNGHVMFGLYRSVFGPSVRERWIEWLPNDDEATPLVADIKHADVDQGADDRGRWKGYRRIEPHWYLVGYAYR